MGLFGKSKAEVKIAELQVEMVKQSQEFNNKLANNLDIQEKAAKGALEAAMRNFSTQIFPSYTAYTEQKAYSSSPNLYSVVSSIANAAAAIPFYPEMPDGSDVKDSDKINKFMSTLTLEQQLQAYTYLLIYGEIFAFKEVLDAGVNKGLKELKLLHPLSVELVVSQTFPIEIVGFLYWDNLHGQKIQIQKEEMVFVKLFNPDPDQLLQQRGLAPVKVISTIIEREKAGTDTSVAQLQNGGTPGVLFPKLPGTSVETAGMRKTNFSNFLNNRSNKGAPYMSSDALEYITIGSEIVDLDLINLSAENIRIICAVYHVDPTNYGDKSASTESNVQTHDRSFYTKGVMPLVQLWRDGINRQALPDIDTEAIICEDISDIQELQPNFKEMADGLAAMPFIIPNDMFEKLGWSAQKEEIYKQVWAKNGYLLAEESTIQVEPVNNAAGDYNNVVPIGRAAVK